MRKILVSDYDYTLRDHNQPWILGKNLAAIKQWRDKGNILAIATGRNLSSLAYIFPDYKDYADYLLLNDGAEAYDNAGNIIYSDELSDDNIAAIKELLKEARFADNHTTVCYVNGIGLPHIHPKCNKIRIWFQSADDCNKTAALLRRDEYRDKFTITWHCNITVNFDTREFSWVAPEMFNFLEITNAGIDKSVAISKVFTQREDHIVTVGDDYNDIKMIQDYDGYVMAHADRDIVRRFNSDRVVTSLYELIDILLAPA